MPNNDVWPPDVWPPKPSLPDPLTEYDEVIAAKLAALSETKTEPNRILLIKTLRDEEGMELRQAYALVNNYCARNSVLVQTSSFRIKALLGCLPPLLWMCFAGFAVYWMRRRDDILSQPHHHAAFLTLTKEALMVWSVAVILTFTNVGIQLIRFRRNRQK